MFETSMQISFKLLNKYSIPKHSSNLKRRGVVSKAIIIYINKEIPRKYKWNSHAVKTTLQF